jgi:hypothetical protein
MSRIIYMHYIFTVEVLSRFVIFSFSFLIRPGSMPCLHTCLSKLYSYSCSCSCLSYIILREPIKQISGLAPCHVMQTGRHHLVLMTMTGRSVC